MIRLPIFEFVKQRRRELGLTQVELAEKANVSLYTVKRIEAKRPYNPRGTTFMKLAKALEADGTFMLMECVWG